MYNSKIIVVAVLSALITLSFLLFSFTTTIHQKVASAFFHERLFEGNRNTNAQLTTDVNPTASSNQTGTPGDDDIKGSDVDDLLVGLAGNDVIAGQAGSDNIDGSEGYDYLIGGPGNDSIAGGAGIDVIEGNAGGDNIYGSEGNDYLIGGVAGDNLKGAAGNDTLIGGPGADTLTGGLGQDKFICGQGKDIVLDFNATEGESRSIDCEADAATTATNNNKSWINGLMVVPTTAVSITRTIQSL